MNHVSLLGRLTRDVDLRYAQNADTKAVGRFTLAVDRKFKRAGESSADFISCVAFGKTAETLSKYVLKGHQVAVQGRMQTGSYEKEGRKIYTTDVIVEDFTFCNNKTGSSAPVGRPMTNDEAEKLLFDGSAETLDDDDLPFYKH